MRWVIAWKVGKGAGQLLLAMTLAILAASNLDDRLRDWARVVEWSSTTALSVRFARTVLAGTDGHALELAAAALGADGLLTLAEGWLLRRGRWWAPWLVAASSGVFVPFEAVALMHRLRPFRLLALIGNLVIVAYLLFAAWRVTLLRRQML